MEKGNDHDGGPRCGGPRWGRRDCSGPRRGRSFSKGKHLDKIAE